ncbi:FAD-dependent monooxygenase [Nocardia sp. NPDC050406]|uniref:FAD-dependent monooxygenase n=1 Tax=Nocardia sp. NPDC050406 TaxID=3364318 RepID=UPI003799CEC5
MTELTNRRVLVAGAGIAGLTTAYWLSEYGFEPTVVELRPALSAGGQTVDVRDQSLEVVRRMGVEDEMRKHNDKVEGMRLVDAENRCLATTDMRGIRSQYGSIDIPRPDAIAILYALVRNRAECVFGDSIRSLRQHDTGVAVSFEHAPEREFDLVIGADGLHSTVRRFAFGAPDGYTRFLRHYVAFGDADPALGPEGQMTLYNTPGRMVGVYHGRGSGQVKGYFAFHSAKPLPYDPRDPADQKRLLAAAFADVTTWFVPDLLASALADPDLYFDAMSQIRMPSWSTGRIALVGDAAYCAAPVSAAGAELALTGGYVLAGELAAAAGDHRTAFARYQHQQRPLVERKQRVDANLRFMVPRTRRGIWTRNTIARLPLLKTVAGLANIMAPKTTAPLPHYELPRSS